MLYRSKMGGLVISIVSLFVFLGAASPHGCGPRIIPIPKKPTLPDGGASPDKKPTLPDGGASPDKKPTLPDGGASPDTKTTPDKAVGCPYGVRYVSAHVSCKDPCVDCKLSSCINGVCSNGCYTSPCPEGYVCVGVHMDYGECVRK